MRPDDDKRQGHRPSDYRRLSAAEFMAGLDEFGLTAGDYCRITGKGHKTVARWLADEDDVEPQAAINFAMWRVPGALQAAREEADRRLLPDGSP